MIHATASQVPAITWLAFPGEALVDEISGFVDNKALRLNEMRAERNLEPYSPEKSFGGSARSSGLSLCAAAPTGPRPQMRARIRSISSVRPPGPRVAFIRPPRCVTRSRWREAVAQTIVSLNSLYVYDKSRFWG